MTTTGSRLDRATGLVLGTACGDALGAGYEFGPPMPDDAVVEMIGGGAFHWAPGEWTDDTSMAVPVLRAVADGRSLLADDTLAGIVGAWRVWSLTAPDVGAQTSAVLGAVGDEPSVADVRRAAQDLHERTGRSGGNGSLMRTAPVVLPYLGEYADVHELAAAAEAVSSLTHVDPDAGDACVLWCAAMRHAVRTETLDVRVGLDLLPATRRDRWAALVTEAEARRPRDFAQNGWVVQAFQAAWSAIVTTPVPTDVPADHLRLALEAAVRGGNDTDTVAAIAGGLLGARWGASAVPARWRSLVHGWPGIDADELSTLAAAAARL